MFDPVIHARLRDHIMRRYDAQVMNNSERGRYVEVAVAHLLGAPWRLSAPWRGYDLVHPDGTLIEVRQTARRQSWTLPGNKPPKQVRFRIAPRLGVFDGVLDAPPRADAQPVRAAHLYVLAYHHQFERPVDHRDLDAWRFWALPTAMLPPHAKSMAISTLQRHARPVSAWEIAEEVERVLTAMRVGRFDTGGLFPDSFAPHAPEPFASDSMPISESDPLGPRLRPDGQAQP